MHSQGNIFDPDKIPYAKTTTKEHLEGLRIEEELSVVDLNDATERETLLETHSHLAAVRILIAEIESRKSHDR
jgi:hypothetical protein